MKLVGPMFYATFFRAFILMTISVLVSAHATAAPKMKLPVEDYVEKNLRDCMMYENKDIDECETQLRVRYKKVPYLTGTEFIERLAKNQSYLRSLTIVSEDQLLELTKELRTLPIDYYDEIDGCAARAELMSYYLAKKRIVTGNVYARGTIRIPSIHIPLTPATIQWGFHVAPFIMVKNSLGKIYPYSLDLTLLNGTPRPLNEWLSKLEAENGYKLELHALKSFETSPTEAGETPVRSWKEKPVSMLEAQLKEPVKTSVHRGSPIRQDLAQKFLKTLESANLEIRNPYERQYEDAELTTFAKAFSSAKQNEIRSRIESELRCENAMGTTCTIYYRDEADHGFCRISMDVPRTTIDKLRVSCFPFDR